MKNGYVKSSPRFFNLITSSMCGLVAGLLILAAFIPAPLQEQADRAVTPNPARSAWFLLWIQELVSWSRLMVYPVLLLTCLFLTLPWLPVSSPVHRACWFPRGQRAVSAAAVLTAAAMLLLTFIARYFRGADWSLAF